MQKYNLTPLIYFFFLTIILINLNTATWADELVLVQSVSKTRSMFTIRRGRENGVSYGQMSLFSSKDSAIVAKAVEVSRQFSLWRPIEKGANVPFSKGNYVIFNHALETILTTMAVSKLKIDDLTKVLLPSIDIPEHSLIVRGALGRSIYESISETQSKQSVTRTSYQVEVQYNRKLFDQFELGGGFRYDYEAAKIDEVSLVIPTNRYFVFLEATYHFYRFHRKKRNFYVALGIGLGKSTTTVELEQIAGNTTLLPVGRLGVLSRIGESYSLLTELVVEAISTTEYFANQHQQSTSIING
ncbi:MAG: hypothetical protein H8D23_37850, partial [Candidatus Brocadiales bacterium]|nr:hypothetical protein [Candidatus Brocadiales bacterium]